MSKLLQTFKEHEQRATGELKKRPLFWILKNIQSAHTGKEKENKTALTGFLYTLNALTTQGGLLQVLGSSSSGKSHVIKTILKCFPSEWIKEVGEISPQSLKYIEWKDIKILYIKEAGGAEKTTEHLKLMSSDDGGFKALVTRGNPSEGHWTEEVTVPVKFIITTRAIGEFDAQLTNRMLSLSIDESMEQTELILLHKCKLFAGHHKELSFGNIRDFISNLEFFDEIRVPYSYALIGVLRKEKIRVRRDIDKILSLCQTNAFLNQAHRPHIEEHGKKILLATPEDAYNVFLLTFGSFEATMMEVSERLKKVYDAIPEKDAVVYRNITKKTGLKKRTVMRDIETLENLGYVDIEEYGKGKAHLISRSETALDMSEKQFNDYKEIILLLWASECAAKKIEYDLPLSWYDIGTIIDRDKDRDTTVTEKKPSDKNCDKDRDTTVTEKQVFYTREEIKTYFNDHKKMIVSHPCHGDVTLNYKIITPVGNDGLYINFYNCDTVTKGYKEKNVPHVKFDFFNGCCHSVTHEKRRVDEKRDITP